MYMLVALKIISNEFWKTHWRYSFFIFLVVSAIITPDGSGISMLLLSAPLMALYGVGTIISNKREL